MKISVIVPCYNVEDFILEAIKSIKQQTLQPYEVIVIDDASTDKSLEVLQHSEMDITLLHTNRKGGAGTRNAGIKASTGDWVAFLDADDVWYPDHLRRATSLIQSNQIAGYINHYDEQRLPGNKIQKRHWPFDSPIVGHGLTEYIDVYKRYGNFVGMSACMVEKEVLDSIGGFDESMIKRHDIECWLRVIDDRRWIFDNVSSSLYRTKRQGSLSEDRTAASLYRFLAFHKHADKLTDYAPFTSLQSHLAERALRNSYRRGNAEDRKVAYRSAFASLDRRKKAIYGVLKIFPFLFNRLKKSGLL